MNLVTVRNTVFGQGAPKICVPIMGKTLEGLSTEIAGLKGLEYDVIEWRMDHFTNIMDADEALKAVKLVRELLGDATLLATFRTSKEGGEMAISNEDYVALNKAMIASGQIDLVDVECFTGDEEVAAIVEAAHAANVYVVMSNHDFHKTPDFDEIVRRLTLMEQKGADIPKIALMPTCKEDVLTVLSATQYVSTHINQPIITMSMGSTGVISRLCGEVFGSCLTFGAAAKASAPGQIDVKNLKEVLTILHNAL